MPPLAERMRPQTLEDYIGQAHLVGEGAVLHNALDKNSIPSCILWGPPGVGKTTLANILAHESGRAFFSLSAINSGVKDVRDTIAKAEKQQFFGSPSPILFIDEIHRFSKSQQDSLLGAVERGVVTLIGATTENPSFEVIPALLSRCQVYVLEPLSVDELKSLIDQAIEKDYDFKEKDIKVEEYDALLRYSGGDARRLLNAFELLINAEESQKVHITNEKVLKQVQQNPARYDKTGEQHYDIISAFIKSVRGGDPQAAVYWLARMVEGGEDVKFIARRLLILAAEDIGLANPNALLLAQTTFEAVQSIGWPESRIVLSQCTIYLATSPKSNAAYMAINNAQQVVRQTGDLSVPLHLRNAPTKLMKALNYGENYKYSHDFPDNHVKQQYLPDQLSDSVFYAPQSNAAEQRIKEYLKKTGQLKNDPNPSTSQQT